MHWVFGWLNLGGLFGGVPVAHNAPAANASWSIMQALTQKNDDFDNQLESMDFTQMDMATSTSPESTIKTSMPLQVVM